MTFRSPFYSALLATSFLLAPVLEAAEPGAESPAALVERLRTAGDKEDFAELAACLAPAARMDMAKGLYAGATMMVAMSSAMGEMAGNMGEALGGAMGEESAESKAAAAKAKAEADVKFGALKKSYNDVAAKHGLPSLDAEEMPGDPEAIFAKADLIALIGDFGGLIKSLGEDGGEKEKKNIEGQLEDLKIEGEKAEGTLGGDPIQFVKLDGRWFISELPAAKTQGDDEEN